jgi:hypothetical protein
MICSASCHVKLRSCACAVRALQAKAEALDWERREIEAHAASKAREAAELARRIRSLSESESSSTHSLYSTDELRVIGVRVKVERSAWPVSLAVFELVGSLSAYRSGGSDRTGCVPRGVCLSALECSCALCHPSFVRSIRFESGKSVCVCLGGCV